MSIIRNILYAVVAISVLAFQSVSHAETPEVQEGQSVVEVVTESVNIFADMLSNESILPVINLKELQCLARNIFYEAASEPIEGKVAVGLVTINRLEDGRFGKSICGVVGQKTTLRIPKRIMVNKERLSKKTLETITVYVNSTICQFSWRCSSVRPINLRDERWEESLRIAQDLLENQENYSDLREKYSSALYFHAHHVRPSWAHQKVLISKIGGHRFYKERQRVVASR